MSIEIGKLERLGYFNFAVFIISFWIFFVTKILVFVGALKFSNTLNNIEFFSFFIMVATLILFLNSIFERRNKKERELVEKNELHLSQLNEIKMLKDDLEQMNDFISNATLVSKTDAKGKITYANKKFIEVSGWTEAELIGKDHAVLNSGIHPSSVWANMYKMTVKDKKIWNKLVINKAKDGSLYYVDSYVKAFFDSENKLTGFISIRQDVTETMTVLNDLENKNTYLEHAAKILRHDMHSGINTYMPRGIKSLLRRLTEEQINELKIEAPIKMIDEGLKHTQRVYKGVYEFTNLVKPNSTLNKESCDLGKILHEFLRPLNYSDMVKIDALPTLDVNRWLFCTAVDNLIRNGLKYNDSKRKMIMIYQRGDYMIIEDNGRGMSPDEFNEYSKPYIRNKKNKESGSGLGLNICIAIMNEHGFKVHSELNQSKPGTKIYIKIKNN